MSDKPTAAQILYPTQAGVPTPSTEPHPLYQRAEPPPPPKSTREQFSAADFFDKSGYAKPEPPPAPKPYEDPIDAWRRAVGLPPMRRR